MPIHITKEYVGLAMKIAPTYCGFKAKKIHQLTNHTMMGVPDCLKCIDLYYQDYPNVDAGRNPYFSAHNSEGNEKLRAIKAKKAKKLNVTEGR